MRTTAYPNGAVSASMAALAQQLATMGGNATALQALTAAVDDAKARADAATQAAATANATAGAAHDVAVASDTAATAAQADATAAMTRATTLQEQQTQLEALAATLGQAIPNAEAVHGSLQAQITALAARGVLTVQSKRVTTTALLALGASVDLTVTWPAAFPDSAYHAIPLLDASTGLSNATVGVKPGTTAPGSCVVTVRANVAVAAGLAVNVIGLRVG